MSQPPQAAVEPPERDRRATYAAVVVVEILVVLALWAFSRYFGR
jgi:hypothetical protein